MHYLRRARHTQAPTVPQTVSSNSPPPLFFLCIRKRSEGCRPCLDENASKAGCAVGERTLTSFLLAFSNASSSPVCATQNEPHRTVHHKNIQDRSQSTNQKTRYHRAPRNIAITPRYGCVGVFEPDWEEATCTRAGVSCSKLGAV